MPNETEQKGEIVIYKGGQSPELRVSVFDESVWMTQGEISDLYSTDRSSITKHIKNIIKSGELQEKSNVQNLHIAGSDKPVKHYNLDFILSVGYRVNSKKATQFRIWATSKLREYLMKGFLVDEKRLREAHETKLKELQQAHLFIRQALEAKRLLGFEKELGSIINDYTQTWIVLDRYDEGDLKIAAEKRKNIKNLEYSRAKAAVEHFKGRLMESERVSGTFGHERAGILEQTLKEVAKTGDDVVKQSAVLFYSIIKNRPFVDGNKRIASLLFVLFLIENNFLYDKKGERKFNDNGLIALALLIEETKPSEKETLLKLISNLVNKK